MELTTKQLAQRHAWYTSNPICKWVSISEYFGISYERCYWGAQAKALYRAEISLGKYLLSESLAGIRSKIKAHVKGAAQ